MINDELFLHITKKLESGEIYFEKQGNEYFLYQKGSNIPIKIGEVRIEEVNYNGYEKEDWNKKFKEKFYKDKNLDNCWYKDCSNKIYQTENDYKAVNIQCQDKHKRFICLDCYETKYREAMGFDLKMKDKNGN